ncbi:MAG: carboxypeptidase regulatory-like domain-containing protein, partial [Synergistales bacterium]|nr:carboxypeptidase regulatory-like domain-containing protein [Synergistales bacterium]
LYPGMMPDPFYHTVTVPGETEGLNFGMIEGTNLLSGYVQSTTGAPVPNVDLYITNGFMEFYTQTDENGYYEALVMPGYWEVEIEWRDIVGSYLIPYGNDNWVEIQEEMDAQLDIVLYPVFFVY